MTRAIRTGIATAAVLLYVAVAYERASGGQLRAAGQTPAAGSAQAPRPAASPQRALIDQYCMGCHSDKVRSGGLALSDLDFDAVDQHADIAEKVIRKLRGGLMPPAGVRRPDAQSTAALVSWLETKIDSGHTAAAAGRVPLRRLNRREYANA